MAQTQKKDKYIYIKIWIIFFFTLAMIIWTVVQAIKADVGADEDNAFLSTYHDVDKNFNNMNISNKIFNNKYNVKFNLNGKVIQGLDIQDVFLGQRTIKERKIKKDLINIGKNSFSVVVTNKQGKIVQNVTISMLITKAISHKFDKHLTFTDKKQTQEFNIDEIGYWNITGIVVVGTHKGYFYIKTNAKK